MHGWSSTPYEMRALGEFLHGHGYTVYAPLLAGHGTVPEDLENVHASDWQEDVDRAYKKISQLCDSVFVGGMSLGGSLAMHFAKEHSDIGGLILMGTPYKVRYQAVGSKIYRAVMLIKKYKHKKYPKVIGADTCMTQVLSYQKYPMENAYRAFQFTKNATKELNKISVPTMIIQSRDDHIIARGSMKRLAKELGSDIVEKKKIKNAYHNFIGDHKNNYIFEDILSFITKHSK